MDKLQAQAPFSGDAVAYFQSANSYSEVIDRMCAPQSEIVFFDFETTGIVKSQKFETGHPVQIGMVRVRGGVEVGRFMEFMRPGKPLEPWARDNLRDSDGNLLTDSWLQSKRPYEDVLRDALRFLGDTCIVGGQNIGYDIQVMRNSLERMGELHRWKPTGHVDSLVIARAVFQGQPQPPSSFKLERLAQFLGLPPFSAHDAAEDSLASWHVLRATLQRGQMMQEQGALGRLPALPPLLTPNVALSHEQIQFKEMALQGVNMFITGGAGTGKSYLLNSIVAQMQLQHGPKSCAVLSPTGAAAVLVKGRTIHSFFNLGIPKTWSAFHAVQTGRNSSWLKKELKCIIFDEISMISAEMMDLLDANVRAALGKPDQPFGGLQVLMFGDFFQLPPIPNTPDSSLKQQFMNTGLAFQSHCWKQLQPRFCNLKRSFRQQDDQPFLDALERIRTGVLTPEDRRLLCAPKAPSQSAEVSGIVPTKLFNRRADVESANAAELAKLPGPCVSTLAHDSSRINFSIYPPEKLDLKIGAQVMLVKNLDVQRGLVNGSRGVVVGFSAVSDVPPYAESDLADLMERINLGGDVQQGVATGLSMRPIVRFDGVEQDLTMGPLEFEVDSADAHCCRVRRQIPLTLAWSLSIHKAQGMSISSLEVTCQDAWDAGQVYVALSRGRTLRGLTVHSLGEDGCCRADARVVAFYAACEQGADLQPHVTEWADDATIAGMRHDAMSLSTKDPSKVAAASAATAAASSPAPGHRSASSSPPAGAGARVFNGNPNGPRNKDGSPNMRFKANYDPTLSP